MIYKRFHHIEEVSFSTNPEFEIKITPYQKIPRTGCDDKPALFAMLIDSEGRLASSRD
jgi:hypothetical protein